MKRRVIVVYVANCEVLDFAGPLQALYEANLLGANYELLHAAATSRVVTDQGLVLAELAPLPETSAEDLIFVPGFPLRRGEPGHDVLDWLTTAADRGANIFSVCSGAFVLGAAGLLDGRRCTTHWKLTDQLQRRFPKARVLADRLFVEDGAITTSAGIAAGIDMTLALIERHHGPQLAARVAREMVVYLRRDGSQRQDSVYVDHRTHLNPGVHAVQDWLIAHPAAKVGLADLGALANMSVRNLTRAFRESTGVSIHEYRDRLRVEHAKSLMANPKLSLDVIAERCGFADARQFRRLWRARFDRSPGESRRATLDS